MKNQPNKRTILIIVCAMDAFFGAVIILIYFGLFPVDISAWGIPRWVVGVVGGIWFFSAFALLMYQLTKTDPPE